MRRLSVFCGGVALSVGLLVQVAPAQTPATQPADPNAPRPTKSPQQIHSLLAFDELSLELGFETRFDQTRTRYDVDEPFRSEIHQKNRSRAFEETLGIATSGSLGGPRLLLFDIAANWGLTQERFEEHRGGAVHSEDPHGDISEYDLNFTLFPQGTVTFNTFAKREDSRLPRAFLPSLDRTYERYGAEMLINNRTLPMRFTYEHVYDELTSRSFNLLDDERRGHDRFEAEGTWHINDYHALRLEYTYEDRSEQYSGTRTKFNTDRHYLLLNDKIRFGADKRSWWETELRWQEEAGDLARDYTDFNTRLRLQHTKQFSSDFKLQYLRDGYQGLTADTLRGEAGVTYQLDKWLTASLSGYALHYQADESPDFNEYGLIGDVSFRQDNEWGELSGHVGYNYVRSDTQDGRRSGIVASEAVTFRDPLPAYLVRTDVVWSSIVITDAARTRTYLPGRDYVVSPRGRYTAIRRVPTGAIANRQQVLVSYRYRSARDFDVTRNRFDWRVQQEFENGLMPYYAGSIQCEDFDDGDLLRYGPRDIQRHRVGLTWRQPKWSMTGEYEYNDDDIDPYSAVHFNGDVILWQTAQHQLNAQADAGRFWFDGGRGLPSRNTTLIDGGFSYRYLLSRQLEADASALYRWEDDSLAGITHGVDLSGALEWKIGYFSLRFEAEYDLLYLPTAGDDSFAVWLKLKREIPLIARNGR